MFSEMNSTLNSGSCGQVISRRFVFTCTKPSGQTKTWFWRSSRETCWKEKGGCSGVGTPSMGNITNTATETQIQRFPQQRPKSSDFHCSPSQDRGSLTGTQNSEQKIQHHSLHLPPCEIAFLNWGRGTGEGQSQKSRNSV